MTEIVSTSSASGPNRSDLDALKDGAAMMIQAGNRVAALALLWSAVAIDPTDLAAHRRLAATLAYGGDIDGAADEYARYIEFMLPLGEVGRATLELSYGAGMLGGHPGLHAAAEKIVTAVRAIVPGTSASIAARTMASIAPAVAPAAATMRSAAPAITPAAATIAPAAATIAPAAATIVPTDLPVAPAVDAPLPAPRLLPRVPFRFCVHQDGARHWMQLEGGTAELTPVAVRVVDRDEHVIETRLCLPLELGEKGHARVVDEDEPSVAWAVVGISSDVVAAIDAGKPSACGVQAKVGDEWLAAALVDTGCRHGRTRATSAAS